jgi:hypothetical protein
LSVTGRLVFDAPFGFFALLEIAMVGAPEAQDTLEVARPDSPPE